MLVLVTRTRAELVIYHMFRTTCPSTMRHNAVSGSLDASIYSIPCKLFPKFNISETGRALDKKKKKKKKEHTRDVKYMPENKRN